MGALKFRTSDWTAVSEVQLVDPVNYNNIKEGSKHSHSWLLKIHFWKNIIPPLRHLLTLVALAIGATAAALQGHRRVPPELVSGNRQSGSVIADIRQLAQKCSGGAQ